MKPVEIIEQNDGIIKMRNDFIWYYIEMHLDDLNSTCAMEDEKFKLLYNELCSYVASKCNTGIEGDIDDFYVVIEKTSPKKYK